MNAPNTALPSSERTSLKAAVVAFQTPSLRLSVWQLTSTASLFVAAVAAMYWLVGIGSWWAIAAMVPATLVAAGLLVRIFIIQHDCGHGSYFRSARANEIVGLICGIATFTPFANWRRQHANHHGNWNNLDRRASGVDIYSTCMTVNEYAAMTPAQRWQYRFVRQPLIYLMLLPPVVFLIVYRFAFDTPKSWRRERMAVYLNNALLVIAFVTLGLTLGFANVVAVQLPIIAVTAIIGVFLFSVQHRFETTLWMTADAWNAVDASLKGSSFLKLPRVLQWFTGNIGYHHIHHLNSRVPNYRLQACHEAIPALQNVPVLQIGAALRNSRNALWDDNRQAMVSFAEAGRAIQDADAHRAG